MLSDSEKRERAGDLNKRGSMGADRPLYPDIAFPNKYLWRMTNQTRQSAPSRPDPCFSIPCPTNHTSKERNIRSGDVALKIDKTMEHMFGLHPGFVRR